MLTYNIALWLAYWTSAYEDSDDVDSAFYVGVYAALTFTCFFILLFIIWFVYRFKIQVD